MAAPTCFRHDERWFKILTGYRAVEPRDAPGDLDRADVITATPAARSAQEPAIAMAVNACRFPEQPMPPGQGDYEWEVPSHCWRPGPNQLWVGVTPLVPPATLTGSPDTRLLGARVGAVRLARVAIDQNAK